MRRFGTDWLFGLYFAPDGGAGDGGASGDGGGEGGGEGGGDKGGDKGGDGGKTYDEKYVKELRDEAAANRKKAKELETKLKEIDDAKLSETEKLKKAAQEAQDKLTAAQAKTQARLAKAETLTHAAKLNFTDGGDAFTLIQSRIEFDDEGEPKNVEALLKQLAKDKPYLLKTTGGGDGNPANPGSGRGGGTGGGTGSGKFTPPSWGSAFNKKR